jgi:putative membrane protein
MFWYGHGMGGWGYGLMLFNGLIIWALLVGGGVLVYRVLRRSEWSGRDGSAERTLAERYARGEIDDEEYRRRLDTLRRG